MAHTEVNASPANVELVEGAQVAGAMREVVIKAHLVGRDDVQASAAIQAIEANERIFGDAGALPPPFDPEALCVLLENSNALRPNVDSYCANIDSHGHRFEPIINFEAEDAEDRISTALYADRLWLKEEGKLADGAPLEPTAEEVRAKKKELAALARMEKVRLDNWAEYCCADSSLVTVRRRTRMDIETLGNGYWEVLRNGAGEISLIVYVPGFTIRLLPLDPQPVEVAMRVKVSALSHQTIKVMRRFRRFVQVIEGAERVYFKELGDLRIVSRRNGQVFPSVEALKAADDTDEPATEILHFKVHAPRSAYGVPRWMGSLLEVLGSRQASEVNFFYFQNKSVPPLALLVSGGRLSKSSIPRIEDFIENHIKGKKNFHKILILEAESSRNAGDPQHSGRIRLEFHPLTDAQQSDALFQNYDERNIDKVGAAFRMPRLLRGDIRDFNRSCHCSATETLTEQGWKHVDDIANGERIAVYNENLGAIEYVVPEKKLVFDVEEDLLHFHGEATDALVTPDHRMYVLPNGGRRRSTWRLVPADEVRWSSFKVRVAPERHTWEGVPADSFVLPKVCQVERGHRHEPIRFADWLEFLGYFVSEGGLLTTDHPTAPYLVYLDQKKPDVLARMRACLDRIGWTYSVQIKRCGTTHLLLSNRCLRAWLAAHCGLDSRTRRVPQEYLFLDEDHLVTLFDALMRGDGRVNKGRNHHSGGYFTTSLVLANQVQQLCLHLGLRAAITEWRGRAGTFIVNLSDNRTNGLRRQDVERVHYKGRVYCFSVPTHGLFVTRRNGKVAIHGNTALAALHFAEEQVFQPERQEFDFIFNRKLLADMGVRFWRFVSNAPVTRDPQVMAEIVKNLVTANVLTPEEGRYLAGDVFNIEFKSIKASWVKQPIQLTLAGFPAETGAQADGQGSTEKADDDPDRRAIERFRRLKPAQMERETVYVPDAELASWLEPEEGAGMPGAREEPG